MEPPSEIRREGLWQTPHAYAGAKPKIELEPPSEVRREELWCTPHAGAKPKVPALCGIGVLTLQKEGEDSAREPPTAAAERKRKKFVTSNAAEETYNL